MRYKEGDIVRIISKEWYHRNKSPDGNVYGQFGCLTVEMSEFLEMEIEITECSEIFSAYKLGNLDYLWDESLLFPVIVHGIHPDTISLIELRSKIYDMSCELTTEAIIREINEQSMSSEYCVDRHAMAMKLRGLIK